MKLSKLMHVASVIAGLAGVIIFAAAILGGADNLKTLKGQKINSLS